MVISQIFLFSFKTGFLFILKMDEQAFPGREKATVMKKMSIGGCWCFIRGWFG